jgi:hypothetical protein
VRFLAGDRAAQAVSDEFAVLDPGVADCMGINGALAARARTSAPPVGTHRRASLQLVLTDAPVAGGAMASRCVASAVSGAGPKASSLSRGRRLLDGASNRVAEIE